MWVVWCSAMVSERLKTRISLGMHDWQNIISGVEVDNNVKNIKNNWEVSTSFVILYYLSLFHFNIIFYNSSKIKVIKIWGGEMRHPALNTQLQFSCIKKEICLTHFFMGDLMCTGLKCWRRTIAKLQHQA